MIQVFVAFQIAVEMLTTATKEKSERKNDVNPSRKAPTTKARKTVMGQIRTCIKYEKAKGGVLRCADFKKGRGHPVCDSRLVNGGRSPGLVRTPAQGKCKRGGGKRKAKR